VRSRTPAGDDSRCRGTQVRVTPVRRAANLKTSGAVERASGIQLTRIKNWGQVTGVYVDALTAEHGLISQ
jgi:hypothetical protein